jgi:hypothetical protein
MLASVVGVFALLLGILIGFWLRSSSARSEKLLLEQRIADQDQRSREQGEVLRSAQTALAQVQAESSARAGFESLATERERAIAQLSADCVQLRAELKAKADEAHQLAKTIAELNRSWRFWRRPSRHSQINSRRSQVKFSNRNRRPSLKAARKSWAPCLDHCVSRSRTFARRSRRCRANRLPASPSSRR